jgi:Aldo/keto reductase family
VLAEIAEARGHSIAQVALRWLIQQNVAAIPFSSNPQSIADNLNVFDFTLTDDEMKRIAALKLPSGRIANPVERVRLGLAAVRLARNSVPVGDPQAAIYSPFGGCRLVGSTGRRVTAGAVGDRCGSRIV